MTSRRPLARRLARALMGLTLVTSVVVLPALEAGAAFATPALVRSIGGTGRAALFPWGMAFNPVSNEFVVSDYLNYQLRRYCGRRFVPRGPPATHRRRRRSPNPSSAASRWTPRTATSTSRSRSRTRWRTTTRPGNRLRRHPARPQRHPGTDVRGVAHRRRRRLHLRARQQPGEQRRRTRHA